MLTVFAAGVIGICLGASVATVRFRHLVDEACVDRDLANLDAAEAQHERDLAQADAARWREFASTPAALNVARRA